MTDILINNQERSDARGLGNTVPSAPPGLSRSDWGFECKAHEVRSDARGLGNTVPSAPLGLSRSDWGFECKAHAVRSDARGLGNTVPCAPPGCHEVTGVKKNKELTF